MIAVSDLSKYLLDDELQSAELESAENLDLPPIWDDCGLAEVFLRGEIEQREACLEQLSQLMAVSLQGYEEFAELAANSPLASFAEVMVRQRSAQCRELANAASDTGEHESPQSALAALRSAWTLAIWNYEQHNPVACVDYAERAESLLNDACLTTAGVLRDADWAAKLRGFAVSIAGARSLLEELSDALVAAELTEFIEGTPEEFEQTSRRVVDIS